MLIKHLFPKLREWIVIRVNLTIRKLKFLFLNPYKTMVQGNDSHVYGPPTPGISPGSAFILSLKRFMALVVWIISGEVNGILEGHDPLLNGVFQPPELG